MLKGRMLSDTHRTISALQKPFSHPTACRYQDAAYRDSALVCCRCEYVTFPFPFLANAVVIDCTFRAPLTVMSRTSSAVLALSAAATTSSPQHFLACLRMLLVELASLLSKYLLTARDRCRQCFAAQMNEWQQRSSTYSMVGIVLK